MGTMVRHGGRAMLNDRLRAGKRAYQTLPVASVKTAQRGCPTSYPRSGVTVKLQASGDHEQRHNAIHSRMSAPIDTVSIPAHSHFSFIGPARDRAIGRDQPSSSRGRAQSRGAGMRSLDDGSSLPDLQGVCVSVCVVIIDWERDRCLFIALTLECGIAAAMGWLPLPVIPSLGCLLP